MFSDNSPGRWAVLQLPCCPSKQAELSENITKPSEQVAAPDSISNNATREEIQLPIYREKTTLNSCSLKPFLQCHDDDEESEGRRIADRNHRCPYTTTTTRSNPNISRHAARHLSKCERAQRASIWVSYKLSVVN